MEAAGIQQTSHKIRIWFIHWSTDWPAWKGLWTSKTFWLHCVSLRQPYAAIHTKPFLGSYVLVTRSPWLHIYIYIYIYIHIQGDSLARGPKLLSIKNYVNQLMDDELTTGYYQQDGATCHTLKASMREIESFFKTELT